MLILLMAAALAGEPRTGQPSWEKPPTPEKVQRCVRKAPKFTGRVVLTCTAGEDGSFAQCTADRDENGPKVFAACLQSEIKLKATTTDGSPLGSAVVRLPFNLAG
jgi:hypothetical protein